MHDAGHRSGMCVLTFHRVVNDCERDHDITWKSFLGLLDSIAQGGEPIQTRLDFDRALHRSAVALTFDDGTADHMHVGHELVKRGMAGVFFVPAGLVGARDRLGLRQVRELHALGHTLGSHSFSHAPLRQEMSRHQRQRELGDSKAFFEDALGVSISYFAPPGGIGCRWLGLELERHGYEASRSMVWGIYRFPRSRWTIPCVPVTEFTLAQGWVRAALSTHALPLAMRSMWTLKSMVPGLARGVVRRALHGPFRAAG
jgi:hypothetical protein